MSRQQVKQFLNDINENEELQTTLKDVLNGNPDEEIQSADGVNEVINQITEIANDKGYDFTAGEYRAVLASAHMEVKGELSEDELEHVAGGGIFDDAAVILSISDTKCGVLSLSMDECPDWG